MLFLCRIILYFIQEIDQIDVSRRMTKIGEECCGFGAMLRSMIDDMRHGLPQNSCEGFAGSISITERVVEFYICDAFGKLRQLFFFCQPALVKSLKGGKIFQL